VSPQVSVIIPVVERAALVGNAVQSVLAQSFGDLEVILVDDGSSTDLGAALGDFGDGRVRWIRHDRNQGAAAARNSGIRASRASYVAFLDSDDCWRENKLELQLASLREHPTARASCTGFALHRPNKTEPELSSERNHSDWFAHLMWGCNLSFGSTLVAERSVFDEVGLFDEAFRRFEDWDWALRLVKGRGLILLETILCDVHVSGIANAADVERCLNLIFEKHRAAARAHGFKANRRFRSSIWLERSALSYRSGDYPRAVVQLLRSYALHPLRNTAFYRQMLRHLFRISGPSEERRTTESD
jgi:glycosyltransferase involved in cell wall biosynthesis